MQPVYRLLSAAALSCVSASSFAVTTTYTSSAAFLAQVAAGSYTETFAGLANPPAGPAPFSGGGFAYSAAAPSNIYLAGGFLGTNQIDEALTVTFTSGNVKAVGGNFYATDLNDAFQAVSITLKLSDSTTVTFTPSSLANSYRGFTSDVFITSLTISAPGQSLYSGLDNLTVGTVPVPEPGTWWMMGLGLAGLLAYRRRTV
jgi:PEP-CTERM motif